MSDDQTPIDEESEKLLADLEKQDKTPAPKKKGTTKKKRPARKKAGPGTGVASDTPAPTPKKAEPVPVPDVEKSDDNTVTNISKNPRRIGGTTVPVGKSYTLTEQDLENEILCKKVDHAIALGLFSHGAD